MRNGVAREETQKKVLSVREAALLLNISERAAWLQLYRKRLPHHRWGRKVVILRDELDAFLKALDGVSVDEAIERASDAR